jgi:hypothetical protein
MTKAPLCLAAAAAFLSLAATAALAADTKVLRTYSEDDCQEMNAQIDDSIESTTLDKALAAKIRKQRAIADDACNSGDYAGGTRALRRVLDEVIAARAKAGAS